MKHLNLSTSSGKSELFIGGKLSDAIPSVDKSKTIVLADENLLRLQPQKFEGFKVISVGSGEQAKSMDQAIKLYHKLLELEADREWLLIGAGGGITTDLSGFVASTFLRGISFGFVSTTLLGQVDASVGGKNGVNLDGYKNMIGVIRQPKFVFCDIDSLTTLPEREFIGGFAEIIKCGAIRDKEFFGYLQNHIGEGLAKNTEVLETIICRSVKNKVEVVQSDENEIGERKTLNFGHTFAHAFEKLYHIPHGQAVAVGMVLASRLSVNLGILEPQKAGMLEELIKRAGLPVSYSFDADSIADAMKKDKKRSGEAINFVLLEDIGKAVMKKVPVIELKSMLHDLR